MKKIVMATKNDGKVKEVLKIMDGVEISTLRDLGLNLEINENGKAFEENALIKAREVCRASGEVTVADDSGLEVFYLDNRPGIYSARYGGENVSDEERMAMLLNEMKDAAGEQRGARFVCAAAVVCPDGREAVFRGETYGVIIHAPRGRGGFGYDPIFMHLDFGLTFAEMDEDIKNQISHRAKAFRRLSCWLTANI